MLFFETILAVENIGASGVLGFTRVVVVGSLVSLSHTRLAILPLSLPQLSLKFPSRIPGL